MSFKFSNDKYIIEEFLNLNICAGYGSKEFTLEKLKKLSSEKNKITISGVQTHSNNVVALKKELPLEKKKFEDTDGLITNNPNLILYTKHADCLAIYFYDKINNVVGICHSGWKGSFNEICINMIEKFISEFDSKKDDIIIGIGIGISSKNYEVSKEFKKEFYNKFHKDIVESSFHTVNDKIYFDNGDFNFLLLIKNGIKKENIYKSEECTYDNLNLHSYRRDKGHSGRNLAYFYINN